MTRARAQASELAARLRALGAEVVEAPAIRIEPLDGRRCPTWRALRPALPHAPQRRPSCCSSASPRDARALAGRLIAAIGPGTARALRERGIEPDVVPERAVAESLVEALDGVPVRRALVARAQEARDVLPDALRERGVEVDVLALYRTVAEPLGDDARAARSGADFVTFTSPRPCASSSTRPAASARAAAHRLDRPGHQRRAARARARARRRGDRAHADGLVRALLSYSAR